MRQDTGEGRLDAPRLPDLCNMGIWLRVLLAVNAAGLAFAFDRQGFSAALARDFIERSALIEPVTLGTLVVACALRRLLARLGALPARVLLVAAAALFAAFFGALFAPLGEWPQATARAVAWAVAGAVLLIAWLDQRARARSPAVVEARLMALSARIRPHFLFNSLNAVLGTMRADPRRAERALEELADLFRVLMRDNRELTPLSEELALARQYLELERLRLGERLKVRWEIDSCPPDALVPPLMLQPLLENAVYHGIEPAEQPGEVVVRIARAGGQVRIELENPLLADGSHHAGNQMALANIRERLMLFYDLEAELLTEARDGFYRVRILIPYRPGEAA